MLINELLAGIRSLALFNSLIYMSLLAKLFVVVRPLSYGYSLKRIIRFLMKRSIFVARIACTFDWKIKYDWLGQFVLWTQLVIAFMRFQFN